MATTPDFAKVQFLVSEDFTNARSCANKYRDALKKHTANDQDPPVSPKKARQPRSPTKRKASTMVREISPEPRKLFGGEFKVLPPEDDMLMCDKMEIEGYTPSQPSATNSST